MHRSDYYESWGSACFWREGAWGLEQGASFYFLTWMVVTKLFPF